MLVEIDDYKEYSMYIRAFSDYHFAQSKVWLKARQNSDKAPKTYGFVENGRPVMLAQVSEQKILRGRSMFTVPFGPIVNAKEDISKSQVEEFLQGISKVLQDRTPILLQVNPFSFDKGANQRIQDLFGQLDILNEAAVSYQHAPGTLVFDTSRDPEKHLMPNFRKDARYNVNRAIREDKLSVKFSNDEKAFGQFWNLYEDLQRKANFVDDRREIFGQMIRNEDAIIVTAEANAEVVSAIYLGLFKEESTLVTFLSGTTKKANRLRAPSLLRWEVFKWAYQNGFAKVDFFAIKRESGGYTKFKKGFGGKEVWFDKPLDLVLDKKWYTIHKIISKIRD